MTTHGRPSFAPLFLEPFDLPNPDVRDVARGKAGVYILRQRGTVRYVGSSVPEEKGGAREPLRLWKTILRHFQRCKGAAPGRYGFGDDNFCTHNRNDWEVAIFDTHASDARKIEQDLIEHYTPTDQPKHTSDKRKARKPKNAGGRRKRNPRTVHGVLAGAYRAKDPKSVLFHYSDDDGRTALCGRVKPDALCDEFGTPKGQDATCERCLAKARAANPRAAYFIHEPSGSVLCETCNRRKKVHDVSDDAVQVWEYGSAGWTEQLPPCRMCGTPTDVVVDKSKSRAKRRRNAPKNLGRPKKVRTKKRSNPADNAEDRRVAFRFLKLATSGHVASMRDACKDNDPNGDFDDATAEELAEILATWAKEVLA